MAAPQTIGVGMVEMDIALFMLTVAAICVQLYYLKTWMRLGWSVGIVRWLRLAGWLILSARFGSVLFTVGDIAISLPGAIALIFLAASEIACVLNRGTKVPL